MTIVFNATALTGTDDGGGNSNENIRVVLVTANLSAATGNQCQLVFRFGTGCPTETGSITSVWFGQSGGTAPNFTGDQVQVFFGGAATINGSAAGVVTSDVFTLAQNWDNTKSYTCAFHYKNGSAATSSQHNLSFGNDQLWAGAGTDSSSQTAPTGLSGVTADYFLQQVIITAAGGAKPPYNPWPQLAPILGT
ncbi:hypothetical protein [Bradyrhizobium sp. Cp5.3]|uniref:hypothetical protein n=1 Tax=Bradyrhizobium sp. Cp5.3 TaxID=443598 RepID=UPI0003FEA7B7|nr:hypothetical protein [Bradyrhizobium sp. Cp5.3]